jgi:hypothetical protein
MNRRRAEEILVTRAHAGCPRVGRTSNDRPVVIRPSRFAPQPPASFAPACCEYSGGMGSLTVTGELVARGPAAAFVLEDEQVAAVGEGAKRFAVSARVNGYEWRTSVTRMRGEFLVGLNRAVREAAGVSAGDTVTLELELDTAPREIDMPYALTAALAADAAARAAFDGLAFTHRKEFARWIEEAKRDETRERRVASTLQMLSEGRTRS